MKLINVQGCILRARQALSIQRIWIRLVLIGNDETAHAVTQRPLLVKIQVIKLMITQTTGVPRTYSRRSWRGCSGDGSQLCRTQVSSPAPRAQLAPQGPSSRLSGWPFIQWLTHLVIQVPRSAIVEWFVWKTNGLQFRSCKKNKPTLLSQFKGSSVGCSGSALEYRTDES